jgi:hypothetical protein
VVRLGEGWDLQVPQVVEGSFGALEEGEWGCRGVVKQARGVSEDGMAVRPNQWRDVEQRMGERGVRNEVDRDRQRFVRESGLTCKVIRRAHFKGVAIWESEENLEKRLEGEERR